MIPPYFCRNRPGKIREGDIVTVKNIFPEGIVLEKLYDISTVEDIENGIRRVGANLFFVRGVAKETKPGERKNNGQQ